MTDNGVAPTLPLGWTWTTLGETTEILNSRRRPINRDERATRVGDVPYYGATGQTGWIDDYLFDEELVLLGEDGAPFLDRSKPKAYMIRGRSWVNNHAHVLRAGSSMLNSFLLHVLNATEYEQFVSGTTRLKLPQGTMRNIPIPLPPLPEQYRIVAAIETHLTRLDAAVTALERARARLKRYRAAVLKAACEGRLVPTEATLARTEARSYEPATALLARIQDDRAASLVTPGRKATSLALPAQPPLDSSQLPEGWTWATVEQCMNPKIGMITGPFGTLIGKSDFRSSGVPVAGIPNISDTGFTAKPSAFLSPTKATELERYALHAGDLAVSRSGTVGEICVIPPLTPKWIMSTNLMRLRPASAEVNPVWLVLNFRGSDIISQQLDDMCKGSTRSFLNLSILSRLLIRLPPLTEQERIVAEVERRLSVLDQLDATVTTNLKRADALRQSVLHRAFSGQLISRESND